jgi:branched-chain amino acid aminotransferase
MCIRFSVALPPAMMALPVSELPVKEMRFTRDEMYIADEMFFTGTAAEITPVREIDDRRVGTGKPGPVTKQIQEKFFGIIRGREALFLHWMDMVK